MKRLIVFLGLTALALRGMAQVNGPPQHDPFSPDMDFTITFSALSNSPPPSSVMVGNARYFRYFPTPFPPFVITNRFELIFGSPVPAEDAWILEEQGDGSFMLVTNLNQVGGPDVYYLGQAWNLTTNQIYSLITSNWYVEVDFGDSNYLANIAPLGGQGPFIGYPVIYGVHSLWGVYPISPNNRNAKVIFDGSNCSDEFYLPIQCVWTAQAAGSSGAFTVTNLMTTNTFSLGTHTVTLQLSDGVLTPPPIDVNFQVITAGQAVDWLIGALPVNGIPSKNRQVMVKILSTAAAQFKRGRMAQGCADLETYKRFVKASHLDSYITTQLLQPVQDIINAFKEK